MMDIAILRDFYTSCKITVGFYANHFPQHALNFAPLPQMHGDFMLGSGTVGSMKYHAPFICTKVDSS